MKGQRIGYIRVSTFDQNPERQLESVQVDRTFTDKASGKDVKRPQLEVLMSFVRTGDTVVDSMDRLARNLIDEDVARLSPFVHGHINMLGRYSFAVNDSVARGELRPLRSPSENP